MSITMPRKTIECPNCSDGCLAERFCDGCDETLCIRCHQEHNAVHFNDVNAEHKCQCNECKDMLVLYECGICSCYHPWSFDGDCRDDANRYGDPEEFAEKMGVDSMDVEVRSMEDRVNAD